MKLRIRGSLLLMIAVMGAVVFGRLPKVQAQADSGFTLDSTVNAPTVTFTDTKCAANATCAYEITAFGPGGESKPTNVATATNSGPLKTITLTWGASTSTSPTLTGYKVYSQTLSIPNQPGVLGAVSN